MSGRPIQATAVLFAMSLLAGRTTVAQTTVPSIIIDNVTIVDVSSGGIDGSLARRRESWRMLVSARAAEVATRQRGSLVAAVIARRQVRAGPFHRIACSNSSITVSLYDTPIDEDSMSVVTVSPKFQVVIPREIREALRLGAVDGETRFTERDGVNRTSGDSHVARLPKRADIQIVLHGVGPELVSGCSYENGAGCKRVQRFDLFGIARRHGGVDRAHPLGQLG